MTIETDISEIIAEERDAAQFRSLESRALKGTYVIVIFYGLALSLRLVSSVILTRLFAPEYFGLMALLTTVIVGLNLFSHIGLEDSIIQNPRGDDPVFLNTAWTIQSIRGVGLWLLTILLAWPVARFYHEPRMIYLLPAVGFCCVIGGFSSPSLLTLSRHIGVAKLSLLELISQFVLFAVSLIWAMIHPTIWALVAGKLIAELVRTAVSYGMLAHIRPKFTLDKESVRSLVTFGRWILVGTALTFLALQSDRLILAKLVSFQMLGIYGIAFALSDIPRQIILQFCTRVGFPFIARFADKPRPEFRAVLLKYRMLVLGAGGLLLTATICTGDIFIAHVYDKRYQDAAWMIGILALGLWHTLLYSTVSPAIMSLQKLHYNAFAYLLYCIALFISLPLGLHWFGMVGAVAAVAFSDLPVYFVNAFAGYQHGMSTIRQDAWMTIAFIGVLAAALALRSSLGYGFPFPRLH